MDWIGWFHLLPAMLFWEYLFIGETGNYSLCRTEKIKIWIRTVRVFIYRTIRPGRIFTPFLSTFFWIVFPMAKISKFELFNLRREKVLSEIWEAFGHYSRPETFIRGTCSCDECMEHEDNMQRFDRGNLSLEQLNNPAWDPICFASNEAFAYFMPGLVKLLLNHTDDYTQQFIFHVEQPERLSILHQSRPAHLRKF